MVTPGTDITSTTKLDQYVIIKVMDVDWCTCKTTVSGSHTQRYEFHHNFNKIQY